MGYSSSKKRAYIKTLVLSGKKKIGKLFEDEE